MNLKMIASWAGLLAAPSLFASMQVTLLDNTGLSSHSDAGEFRAVGNDALDAVVNWEAYSSATTGTVGATAAKSWSYKPSRAGGKYFETFWIEYDEMVSPGTPYNVGISDNSRFDQAGKYPETPVTLGTAWLYSHFAAGTLAYIDMHGASKFYRYAYGTGRTSDAGALQAAIWFLQGEEGGLNNVWAQAAQDALGGLTACEADAKGRWGVKALNLDVYGQTQNLLVVASVPEPPTHTAGALLLLALGASTLRVLRKNRAA